MPQIVSGSGGIILALNKSKSLNEMAKMGKRFLLLSRLINCRRKLRGDFFLASIFSVPSGHKVFDFIFTIDILPSLFN